MAHAFPLEISRKEQVQNLIKVTFMAPDGPQMKSYMPPSKFSLIEQKMRYYDRETEDWMMAINTLKADVNNFTHYYY